MTNGITFDTLAYAHLLRDAGVPQEQAEAMAKAQKQALDDAFASRDIATRADILLLQKEIGEVKAQLPEMETRMMRWFIATTLTIIGVIIALAIGAATVLAPYLNILFKLGSLAQG